MSGVTTSGAGVLDSPARAALGACGGGSDTSGFPCGVAALAAVIARGELSASAALEHYLARIDALDGCIKSFVSIDRAGARQAAAHVDRERATGGVRGPLAGVPIAVKDNIDVAGWPAAGGIEHYRHQVAAQDAPVVARLRAAGAIILGKLNMHEGALGATTDNPWFGRTENPRRAGFTPGGSSGGSAAAVAAGLCAGALGTDTLGSVRIPAAYCGVTGFKPGRARLSTDGVMPLSWTLDHVGLIVPAPEDLALLFSALVEPAPRWRYPADSAESVQSGAAPDRWTLGVVDRWHGLELEPAVQDAYQEARESLAARGVRLQPIDFAPYEWASIRREGFLLSEIEGAAFHATALATDPQGFSAEFRKLLDYGARQTAPRGALATHRLSRAGASLAAMLEGVDGLFIPTVPQASFAHGAPVPLNQADLTAPANILGAPAVAIPWGRDAGGLPLSMQFITPRGTDWRAMHLAQLLATRRAN